MFMEMFSRDAVGDNDILLNISVSRDQSPQERKQLCSLIAELAERTKSGEMKLTITYRNGDPLIMKNNPKNL